MKYSKTEKVYIRYPESVGFNPGRVTGRRLAHIERLHRLGVSMKSLANDDIVTEEVFDRKKLKSIKQNYEELFPGIHDRTRQRDFKILRNIGYPIEYIRE